ncbi:MAG: hypothetical protein AB1758_22085, partial [Candidatus Eremiobacterota bacterium]
PFTTGWSPGGRLSDVTIRPCVATPRPAETPLRRKLLGPVLDDALLVAEFAGVGQAYRMIGSRVQAAEDAKPPLQGLPKVELGRPFVMVPGWTTRMERFEALGRHLTQDGLNGGEIVFVKNGQYYRDRACTIPMEQGMVTKDHKVFEVLLEDPHEPPPIVADELKRNFELISFCTGSPRLDVDAYSMGGVGTRLYLDRGGNRVGKLVLLGSGAMGTRFADLSRQIILRDIRFAMSMGGLNVGDLPALEWLGVDDGKGINNPNLTALNQNWPRQKARIEDLLVLGGDGVATPAAGLWPVTGGDGLVAASALPPPGEKATVIHGLTHHGYLNSHPQVFTEMKNFFGWKEVG